MQSQYVVALDIAAAITNEHCNFYIVQLQYGVALDIAAAITNKRSDFYIYYTSRIWNPPALPLGPLPSKWTAG